MIPNSFEKIIMNTAKAEPNIGKWTHYFDVYERHLQKFRNTSVILLEIGVKNGGSLSLWRKYFGPSAKIFGADIYEKSLQMQKDNIYGNPERIIIGDQGTESFWNNVKEALPGNKLDILIDDGSHIPEHMKLSLDYSLKLLRPGGVYICEDVHQSNNPLLHYVFNNIIYSKSSMLSTLNSFRPSSRETSYYQRNIFAVSFYPYIVVVEKNKYSRKFLRNFEFGTKMLEGSRHNWPRKPNMKERISSTL